MFKKQISVYFGEIEIMGDGMYKTPKICKKNKGIMKEFEIKKLEI